MYEEVTTITKEVLARAHKMVSKDISFEQAVRMVFYREKVSNAERMRADMELVVALCRDALYDLPEVDERKRRFYINVLVLRSHSRLKSSKIHEEREEENKFHTALGYLLHGETDIKTKLLNIEKNHDLFLS